MSSFGWSLEKGAMLRACTRDPDESGEGALSFKSYYLCKCADSAPPRTHNGAAAPTVPTALRPSPHTVKAGPRTSPGPSFVPAGTLQWSNTGLTSCKHVPTAARKVYTARRNDTREHPGSQTHQTETQSSLRQHGDLVGSSPGGGQKHVILSCGCVKASQMRCGFRL